VKSERSCEEAVSEGDLCDVIVGDADGGAESCNAVAPSVKVSASVSDDGGLSCRSARGVNSDELALGNGKESEGIVVSHILLGNEGKTLEIVKRLNVFGLDASLVHLFCVSGNLCVDSAYGFLQAFKLQRFNFFSR